MNCKLIYQTFCLCFFVLLSQITFAESVPTYVLNQNSEPVGFDLHTMFIEDIDSKFSIEDIRNNTNWEKTLKAA